MPLARRKILILLFLNVWHGKEKFEMRKVERLPKNILQEFRKIPTDAIADAFDTLGIRGVVTGISPVFAGAKVCGPAITLRQLPTKKREVLVRHRYVLEEIAELGDVIVIDAGGQTEYGTWGSNLATRAKVKGVEGVVIDGATRDFTEIREIRFPVFARGYSPTGSTFHFETVCVNEPVKCSSIQVRAGDIVVGDDDGIVIVPKEDAEEVLNIAKKEYKIEHSIIEELAEGKSFKETKEKPLADRV